MELTIKEKRLISRHRNLFLKVLRILWRIFSILGVAIFVFLIVKIAQGKKNQAIYQKQLKTLQIETVSGELPENILPVVHYETSATLITEFAETYQRAVDSLGFSSHQLGFSFTVQEMPIGVPGYREYVTFYDSYNGCGCEDAGKFDFFRLEIDPHQQTIQVVTSQEGITRVDYETLYRHPSGQRR